MYGPTLSTVPDMAKAPKFTLLPSLTHCDFFSLFPSFPSLTHGEIISLVICIHPAEAFAEAKLITLSNAVSPLSWPMYSQSLCCLDWSLSRI